MWTKRLTTALLATFLWASSSQAFATAPNTIYLQWTFGLSMWDDLLNTNELAFNGPSVDKTVGFLSDYSFAYDDRGLSTTTLVQQLDPYQWYVRGALVLTSRTFIDEDGQEKYCSSYVHFHMESCPNVVGWFNNFAMPQNLGETVVLIPLKDIEKQASGVPEPSVFALVAAGAMLIGTRRQRKAKGAR